MGVLDRVREERRVRHDFNRLMSKSGVELREAHLLAEWDPPREPEPRTARWWMSRIVILAVSLAVIAAGVVLLAPLPYDPPAPLQNAYYFAKGGQLLDRVSAEERRIVVPIRRVPDLVREAFIAAEDERFYSHGGVDPIAIGRALWQDITGGRFQGGSTITQQLVRNTSDPYVGRERTLARKVHEALMAIRMERTFTKDEILEMYLNQIYFGEGVYGVQTAAQEYFGKQVWNLELHEAATLAGIVASPGRYGPRADPVASRERRDWVLGRMAEVGSVTGADAQAAEALPLQVVEPTPQHSKAAYFVDWLTRDIRRRHGESVLYRGGLRVETTLDLRLQRAAEQAIAGALDDPSDPDAALVAIDVKTGGVLAMVGGRDFDTSQVNLATGQGGSGRQAGSAFKPFVLAQAFQEGISPYTVYPAPGTITVEGHSLSNYGGASYGSLSVASATVSSVNTVFAQLIQDVGPDDVVDMAHRMGIRSDLPAVPSLALGTGEVTPLEMTSAYATLASGGTFRRPTGVSRIVDSQGQEIERIDPAGRRAISEGVAGQVTDLLLDVVAGGTGTAAQLSGVAVAGKTGTAEDNADAWFCGYTSSVAACVWVGHKEGRVPMPGMTGGALPASIWRAFMSQLPVPADPLEGGSGLSATASLGGSPTTRQEPGREQPGDEVGEDPGGAPPPAPPPEEPGGEPDEPVIPDILPPGT